MQETGWAGAKNGDLLALAGPHFDVFTTDRSLRCQQNLGRLKLAFVLLPSNQVPVAEALIPAIEVALTTIKAGDFVEIPLP